MSRVQTVALDAVAAGGVSATFAALLAAGPDVCARYGWSAGLALVPLRRTRRSEVSTRLCYHAALSLALSRLQQQGGSGSRQGGARSGEEAAVLTTALGAAMLAAAFAAILREYATAATETTQQRRQQQQTTSSSVDWATARAAHFLLGFDEHVLDETD